MTRYDSDMRRALFLLVLAACPGHPSYPEPKTTLPMSQQQFAKFLQADVEANVALVKAAKIPTQ